MRQAADNFFKRLETVAAKAEAIRRESDEQARPDRQKRRRRNERDSTITGATHDPRMLFLSFLMER